MNKKTLLITGSDPDMSVISDLTLDTKINFVKKHNYDILVKRDWSDMSKYHFIEHENSSSRKDKSYLDVLGFLRVLLAFEMLKDYNNVIWIDADTLITNSDYTIQDFVTDDHCLFVSYDWSWTGSFSTGNFIVKRHKDTQKLYEAFIETSKMFLNHSHKEQITLNHIYNNNEHLRNVIKILPWKYLNSVPECIQETKTWQGRDKVLEPWTEDSFLAHLTGITGEERIEIIKSNRLLCK